jgi:hypothetical protein
MAVVKRRVRLIFAPAAELSSPDVFFTLDENESQFYRLKRRGQTRVA